MNNKTINAKLVRYELMGVISNWFIPFFGVLFPILLGILLSATVLSEVPEQFLPEARTSLLLSISQMIPLATIFLGHSAIYSQELEKKIPLRMRLFGFPEHVTLIAKLIAEFVFMTIAIILFGIVFFNVFDLVKPSGSAFLITIATLYGIGIICFMLAHGIANFVRKFGLAYGITMIIYFVFMMIGGMMGVRMDMLPAVLRTVASLLPFSYFSQDFVKIWKGQPYDFGPFIQSVLFLGTISAIVLILSIIYRRNRAI